MSRQFPSGVLHGDQVTQFYQYARETGFALPAVNVTGTNTANALMETAKLVNSPVVIQISHGGSAFYAGGSLPNDQWQASIAGAVSLAKHVHHVAKLYDVTVIMHSDHAPKATLPWVDGMLASDQINYEKYGHALFSTHMLDLSAEPLDYNLQTSKKYLKQMSALGITMELEIGITGGEEDGIDNSTQDESKLYTQPEVIAQAYTEFSPVSPNFMIAAAFGNVHGVYKPGNVKLKPEILREHQEYIHTQFQTLTHKPLNLVFHGGSGSEEAKIKEAVTYGVVKFNIDTDTQWAFWEGVKAFADKNHAYLQGQLGNPEGADQPNKKYYDPRKWLRSGEQSVVAKVKDYYQILNAVNRN